MSSFDALQLNLPPLFYSQNTNTFENRMLMLDGMPAVRVKTELLESEQGVSRSLQWCQPPSLSHHAVHIQTILRLAKQFCLLVCLFACLFFSPLPKLFSQVKIIWDFSWFSPNYKLEYNSLDNVLKLEEIMTL